MTTVLLSSASNNLPMVPRNSCRLGPLALALGSSLIISSAYQSKPTRQPLVHLLSVSSIDNGGEPRESMNSTKYRVQVRNMNRVGTSASVKHAEDPAHLKFDNSAREPLPRSANSIHSLYQTEPRIPSTRTPGCRNDPSSSLGWSTVTSLEAAMRHYISSSTIPYTLEPTLREYYSSVSYPERNFEWNQLLDSSIGLSPLCQTDTMDLHVTTATGLHPSFLRLRPRQA